METTPSPNGDNGARDAQGRFAKGNPGGPGNPNAGRVAAWRNALVEAVTPEDLKGVIVALVDHAKAGTPWAIRELLDRCLGKPTLGEAPREPLSPDAQPADVDFEIMEIRRLRLMKELPLAPGCQDYSNTPGLRDL
jgi:hypothetical protein